MKEYDDLWIKYTIFVIVVVIVAMILVYNQRLDNLQEEISQLPHKVCWNETTYGNKFDNLIFNNTDLFIIPANKKFESPDILCVKNDYLKNRYVCVAIQKKEVCKWEGLE